MTRNQETPGRYSKGHKFDNQEYQKKSRIDEKNQYMRSFSRTKTKLRMDAYDAEQYLTYHNQGLYVADAAGALTTGFSNAWDKVWEYGHTKGNMKDLVSGQETALALITGNMLQIVYDLAKQGELRALLPVYTEADTGTFYWTQTSYDNFVNQLEGMPMPKFVENFVKVFNFIIKTSEEYDLHSVTVPPSYIIPFGSSTAAKLSQEEARLLVAKENLANGIAQAEKFGIPMTKFSSSMIDHRVISDSDADARAYFNHTQYKFYNGEQVRLSPAGRMGSQATADDVALNMTTDYSNRKYFFPGNGPDSIIDAFAPLLGHYDATNNLNGGWFINNDADEDNADVNIFTASHYATGLAGGTIASVGYHLLKLLASWNGIAITDESPPSFVLNINSDVNASVNGVGGENNWLYADYHDLSYGTGVTYAQSLNFLISNLVRLTYGGR